MRNLKVIFSTFFLVANLHVVLAQVGINTSTPHESSLLHIDDGVGNKGILIPQVDILDLSIKDPINTSTIAESLLVFNTNTDTGTGYYHWDGSRWSNIYDEANHRKSVKYSSNLTSQNFNTGSPTNVNIFSDFHWNDDVDLFDVINLSTVEVKKTGVYQVDSYLSLTQGDDAGVEVKLRVNGTLLATEYIAQAVIHDGDQNGILVTAILYLNDGDTVQIAAKRSDDTLDFTKPSRLLSDGNSFFQLIYIKDQ